MLDHTTENHMQRRLLAVLLALAIAPVTQAKDLECSMRSDYHLQMHGQAFVFTRDNGSARRVVLGGGRLFIDGREVALNAADQQRVNEYESELRQLLPEAHQVAIEATDIAFSALTEVAHGFADKGDNSTVDQLEQAHRRLRSQLDNDVAFIFNGDIDAEVIRPVITEFVPEITGAAVKTALSVAFSGDTEKTKAFQARMETMGKDIDSNVKVRAEALKPLAHSLCQRTQHLDAIEGGLSLRLNDGTALDLLQTGPEND
jgi:hypothetical protein